MLRLLVGGELLAVAELFVQFFNWSWWISRCLHAFIVGDEVTFFDVAVVGP